VIRRTRSSEAVKVTFAVDHPEPVSVVGDFNGWDPHAHPLRRRSNGLRSVVVTLPTASTFRFRYLGAGGRWFDDGAADALEPNGLGDTHSVLFT
jgi:1,4-alpha-glucan branching enzyme